MFIEPTEAMLAEKRARQARFQQAIDAAKADIISPAVKPINTMLAGRLGTYIAQLEPELVMMANVPDGTAAQLSENAKLWLEHFKTSEEEEAHTLIINYAPNGREIYDAGMERFKTRYAPLFEAFNAAQDDKYTTAPSPASGTDRHPRGIGGSAQRVLGHK